MKIWTLGLYIEIVDAKIFTLRFKTLGILHENRMLDCFTLNMGTLGLYIEIEGASIFTLKMRDTEIPKRAFLALNRDTRVIFRLATEKIHLKISPLRGAQKNRRFAAKIVTFVRTLG